MTLDMGFIEDEMEMKGYPYSQREKVRFEFATMKEMDKTVNKIKEATEKMKNSTFEDASKWLKQQREEDNEQKETKIDI